MIDIQRTGAGVADKVIFSMNIADLLINGVEIKKILNLVAEEQSKAGYHPAGYGGPHGVKIHQNELSWFCYASCD